LHFGDNVQVAYRATEKEDDLGGTPS
jgi:hypothetical protein